MKHHNSIIINDAYLFAAPAALLSVVMLLLTGLSIFSVFAIAVTLFILWFFRNPERKGPADEKAIVSPADGKVLSAGQFTDPDTQATLKRICIFLNIFNVHVNRIPYSGSVEKVQYRKGRFFSANLDKASLENERNLVSIRTEDGFEIRVIQIAGLIARRIVCWISQGAAVNRGDRFGLIRFGSRVEIFLPDQATILVRAGDHVKGAETVIGRMP